MNNKNCPVCNFKNPYGAKICGECGYDLNAPQGEKQDIRKEEKSQSQSEIEWSSIGLTRIDRAEEREKSHSITLILNLILILYGLSLIVTAIIAPFIPIKIESIYYENPYIERLKYFYYIPVGLFLGVLTLIMAYGIKRLKAWVTKYYFLWVCVQILVLFLFRIKPFKPLWLSNNVDLIFSLIITIELLIIPILIKLKSLS